MASPHFPDPITPDSYVPLRIQVYSALRAAIVSGRLKPGERIIEDRLCTELGVSRSPLREALRKLEGEGLVTILPRRGAVVTELTGEDGVELFVVREVLEGLSARLAARYITDDEIAELEDVCDAMKSGIEASDMAVVAQLNSQFHQLVSQASRNRWLREFVGSIRAQTRRVYRTSIEAQDRAAESLAEHRETIAALRAHDPEAAETRARLHIQRAREAAASRPLATNGKSVASN